MNLSYWEIKTWLTDIDFTIIGSGIVGLNTALELRNNYPKAKILILEKGRLPQGASTKNAGFACFGSLSEIIDDLCLYFSFGETALINNVHRTADVRTLCDTTCLFLKREDFEIVKKVCGF